MTGGSFGLRTGSYGSLLQQQPIQNGLSHNQPTPILTRKSSKLLLSGSREKERVLLFVCRFLGRKRVTMLLLVVLALLVFVFNSFTVNRESTNVIMTQHSENVIPYREEMSSSSVTFEDMEDRHDIKLPSPHSLAQPFAVVRGNAPLLPHHCENFAFPPPPPPTDRKRYGPRPCPVCYLPVEQAIASMPSYPSESPVLHNLTYVYDENPTRVEPHRGSEFGGFPTLKQRNDSYDIKESMMVHCGFVNASKPGHRSGFDVDEADLMELEMYHDVIVASAVFGNYDIIQQPKNISEFSRKNVPFYLFIDEETEAYMKNYSVLGDSKRIGLWRIIVVRNVPYSDARRNGKIPKLLLHRIFPNVRYSIWIDGKLRLVVDPFQVLERFLWRQNANFAISRHYKRYDVFVEAEANKAAGKYDNSTINEQIDFYIKEGLQPYSEAKFPITSDVPEGCVIIKEHIPITNLFTCNWFNEVDRFTSRDQLSFSTVRDRIMGKVDWSINMFLDCERRNFVIQAYHRELLEHMPPPPPPRVIVRRPPSLSHGATSVKTPIGKKISQKRGRGDKKRHRKVAGGSRDSKTS
ncbi:probable hexosyltransferase MUCI70 [Pyrus communis]|uniref:probable hexosyltransferase MUCI70 n=1 Tax=Pyrus communis TaxID=23211 RepID=UPI0035C1BD15